MRPSFATMLLFLFCFTTPKAQQLVRITANLYTDSLKKGFYNYINIEGQHADGSWLPLDSTVVLFYANTGHFQGNDLFVDSGYTASVVRVVVRAKANDRLCIELVIPVRKRGFTEALPAEEKILQPRRKKQ